MCGVEVDMRSVRDGDDGGGMVLRMFDVRCLGVREAK